MKRHEADCVFEATARACAEQVAAFFVHPLIAALLVVGGYQRVEVFLDRNSTHQAKMQALVAAGLRQAQSRVQWRFHFLAAYSPQLNVAEYVIHRLRHQALPAHAEPGPIADPGRAALSGPALSITRAYPPSARTHRRLVKHAAEKQNIT